MAFREKLRLDNLYPSIPDRSGRDKLFGRFMQNVRPQLNRQDQMMGQGGRLNQVAQNNLSPSRQMAIPNSGGNDRFTDPMVTKPMDVVFKPPPGENLFAQRTLGIDPRSMSPYQAGTLGLKHEALDVQREKIGSISDTAKGNLAARNRQIDINRFKAEHPDVKIVTQGAKILAIGLDGKIVADLGDTGNMTDRDKLNLEQNNRLELQNVAGQQATGLEGTRQTGRKELAEIAATNQRNLEAQKQSGKPIGSEKVEKVTDTEGNVVGTRSTTNRDTLPPKAPVPVAKPPVMMFGPDGSGPHPIRADMVEIAKSRDKMSITKPITSGKK